MQLQFFFYVVMSLCSKERCGLLKDKFWSVCSCCGQSELECVWWQGVEKNVTANTVKNSGEVLEKTQVNGLGGLILAKKESFAVGVACMAIC